MKIQEGDTVQFFTNFLIMNSAKMHSLGSNVLGSPAEKNTVFSASFLLSCSNSEV